MASEKSCVSEIENGDLNGTLLWIRTYHLHPNSLLENGTTPMHISCQYNQLSILKVLAELGGDVLVINAEGQIPLHTACIYGSKDCIKHLLVLGSDATFLDKHGKKPTDYAKDEARNGFKEYEQEQTAKQGAVHFQHAQKVLEQEAKRRHATELHRQAVLAQQNRQFDYALVLIDEALKICPNHPDFLAARRELNGVEGTMVGLKEYDDKERKVEVHVTSEELVVRYRKKSILRKPSVVERRFPWSDDMQVTTSDNAVMIDVFGTHDTVVRVSNDFAKQFNDRVKTLMTTNKTRSNSGSGSALASSQSQSSQHNSSGSNNNNNNNNNNSNAVGSSTVNRTSSSTSSNQQL